MPESVDGNRLHEKKEGVIEKGVFLTRESDKKEIIKLFLSNSLNVNLYLEKNHDLMEGINDLADSAVKVVDYKNIDKIPNGVELTFNRNVIDPDLIVRNLKKHGFYYNHSKNDLIHYLKEDLMSGNNLIMYNKENPLKLTLITGSVPTEKAVKGWTKFFKSFNWKEPKEREN
jgi:hypothetical protein